MRIKYLLLCLCVLLFSGSHAIQRAEVLSLPQGAYHYQELPSFLKAYLGGKENGKFSIADPGEPWASGCIRQGDLPNQSLEWAAINGDTFQMKYWIGGFVKKSKKITIRFKGDQVLSYELENI